MSRHGSVAEFLQGGVAGIASMVCIGLLAVPMVVESPETKGAARENERALSVNFSPPSGTHFLVANPAIQVSDVTRFTMWKTRSSR